MAGVQIDGVNNKIDFDDDLDTSISANTDDTLVFEAGGTDTMTIINGKVGIGTASPSTNLHIKSTADNSPHLLLENFQNADTDDAPVIELYLKYQTTGGIVDDTDVGVIRFTGDEKDGGTKETYAEIRAVAHDPGQGASNKGHLSFFIQRAGSLFETMTLDEKVITVASGAEIAFADGGATGSLVADTFRLTSALTTTDSDLTANLERADDTLAGHVGTAMSQSSGIFTFPVTGIYYVQFVLTFYRTGATRYVGGHIYGTANDFTAQDDLAYSYGSIDNQSANVHDNITVSCLFDCVNTSTHKVKFYVSAAANTTFNGDSDRNITHMQFIKVGET